jgi:hypothetical protein
MITIFLINLLIPLIIALIVSYEPPVEFSTEFILFEYMLYQINRMLVLHWDTGI